MSHFTKVKTKISNLDHIKSALSRMGYTFKEGDFKVTEYGTSEAAQILLDKSLGLSLQKDGTYAFVGDPWHCKTQKLREYYGKLGDLSTKLSTNYAIEEAKYNLEQQNFYCTDNEEGAIGEDGMITMVFESGY